MLTSEYVRNRETGVWSRDPTQVFLYSDGDEVETRILSALKSVKDRSVLSDELLGFKVDWPSIYHLSSARANLLRPLEGLLRGTVLELGAGCGALTRYLGETASEVIAVEGSARRAHIAALRCEDLPNVRVIHDHFDKLSLPKAAFDAVTLVGVLEYAQVYGNGPDGVGRLLATAKEALRPNGTLILAIENQLGLKYFAGVPEDHFGIPLFGVNDLYTDHSVITFGRRELLKRLGVAGFASVDEFVPLPDYKVPVTIIHPAAFDDDSRIDLGELLVNAVDADPFSGTGVLFSMERAWHVLARNGLVRDLANSFLMVARKQPIRSSAQDKETLVSHYGVAFKSAFLKETRFVLEGGGVRVTRRWLDAKRREDLPSQAEFVQTLEDEEYFEGKSFITELSLSINRDGWHAQDVANALSPWFDWLKRMSVPGPGGAPMVPSRLLDATPANVLVRGSNLRYIDAEWSKPEQTIELGLVAFRGLFFALNRFSSVAPPADGSAPLVSQLTLSTLEAAGIPVSHERAREYWREAGVLHATAFGTPFIGVEYFEQRRLTIRRRPAELLALHDRSREYATKFEDALRQNEERAMAEKMSSLQATLEAAEAEKHLAGKRVVELVAALSDAAGVLNVASAAGSDIKNLASELQVLLDEAKVERERMADRIVGLEKALSDATRSLGESQAGRTAAEENAAEALRKLSALEEAYQLLQSRIDQMQAEVEEASQALVKVEALRSAAESAVLDLQALVDAQRSDLEEARLDRTAAEAKLSELQRTLDLLRSDSLERDRNFVSTIERVEAEKSALNVIIGESREALRQKVEALSDVEGQLRSREDSLREISQRLEDSLQKEVNLNAALSIAAAEVESLSTNVADLTRRMNLVQAEVQAMTASWSWRVTRPLRAMRRGLFRPRA